MSNSNKAGPSKPNKKKNNWFKHRNFTNSPVLVSRAQQINVGPEAAAGGFCPYKAWNHYFPLDDYSPTSDIVESINVFDKFVKDYFTTHDMNEVATRACIVVDCKNLAAHTSVKTKYPNFVANLRETPERIINCIGLATHQYIIRQYQQLASKEQTRTQMLEALADVPVIRARLYNFEPLTALKHLKAKTFGQFVAIRGTLVKVSHVKPLCTTMAFRCTMCEQLQAILLIDNKYSTPTKCVSSSCRGRSFEPLRSHPLTEITDFQVVKLQESVSEEQRETGRMPRTVEVELSRDLADTASPGDVVTITGVVKVKKSEDGVHFSHKAKNKCMFLLHIEGNHVSNSRGNTLTDCRGNSADELLDFSARDLAGIEEIRKQDDIFSLLVASLCPTIFGQDMVKAGMLLCLFGGNQNSDEDRIPVRGNSHILLVGDPGLGKSQLLQAVSRLVPRGVYICGNASSNSGLTVTLTRDSGTGDTGLEAGALVLADQGVCCIDEFDKMTNQHQALLEAMEQQNISIAKAGIVCSMPARCSIIAAANPVGGHYNKSKTVSENLKMGGALLSRFDLVYILLDTPDEKRDKLLSDHVMAMHTGRKKKESLVKQLAAASSRENISMGLLHDRLSKYARKDECDPVPYSLLWKYIAYARKTMKQVNLSPEACQVLKEFYLELRKKGYTADSTPITTRQLESLRRLTEARCKVEFRDVASAEDAREVVEIMQHCLYETFADETNSLQFERSFHGTGVSKRGKIKKLIALLNREASYKSSNLFSTSDIRALAQKIGIEATSVSEQIEVLNNQGFLIKTGSSMYKLQTMD
ncbi:DNA helicase MCM8 [Ciona intestinalis]